jgi:hypothetical protein
MEGFARFAKPKPVVALNKHSGAQDCLPELLHSGLTSLRPLLRSKLGRRAGPVKNRHNSKSAPREVEKPVENKSSHLGDTACGNYGPREPVDSRRKHLGDIDGKRRILSTKQGQQKKSRHRNHMGDCNASLKFERPMGHQRAPKNLPTRGQSSLNHGRQRGTIGVKKKICKLAKTP